MENTIVYITTNLINGKKYIGSHNLNNKYYLGSGVNLKKAIKKHGIKNFKRQTIWEGPEEFMREMEEYYIDYYCAYESPLFYNASRKGTGWAPGAKRERTIENNKKIGDANRRPKPEGFAEKMSKIKTGQKYNMTDEAKAIKNAKISATKLANKLK